MGGKGREKCINLTGNFRKQYRTYMCVQHNNLWIHGRDLLQVNFHYVTIMNHYSTPDIFICTYRHMQHKTEWKFLIFSFYYFPLIALIIEIVMSGLQSNNFKILHLNYWKEFLLSIDFAIIVAAAAATSHTTILTHEFMLA